jgi:type II secretory pathway pseudopilin PulG
MPLAERVNMRCTHGFTYIGLLIAIALIGIGLAAVGLVWSTAMKRERERELLFIGGEFRQAIGRYYEASPGIKQYPRRLEELLEDQRFPVIKRHLRKIYVDPMTGKPNWGLVLQGDQILGVHSQSTEPPLKSANFDAADNSFAGNNTYADWQFVYAPLEAANTAGVPLPQTTQQSQTPIPDLAPMRAPSQSPAPPPTR